MRREAIGERFVSTELLERRGERMFPKLTTVQLARLVSHSSPRVTQADEILLEAGAAPRGVFIVISGSVEVLAPASDARPPE